MSWITILWSMNAAACLTLAAIYLLVWSKHREDWVHLLFSFTAISVAVIAGFELAMMRSETTEQFGTLMRWAHVPLWALLVSLVWFVRFRLRAGRTWLAWSVCALRSLALLLDFLFSPNLNYRQITSLQQVSWWGGEKVSVAIGVPNPWTLIGHLGLLLLLVFLIDATVVAWRRGDRRRALIVGGGAIFFVAMGSVEGLLVIWGVIRSPFFISFPYLGIVVAMAYELSSEVLRAAQIAGQLRLSESELRESEARFRKVADSAPVLIWMSGLDRLCTFFNKPWLEFTGRSVEQELGNGWSEGVHPDDLPRCLDTYVKSFDARVPFVMQYRLRQRGGEYRWVSDNGVPRYDTQGRFAGYIGSCIDVSELLQKDEALHESEDRVALAAETAHLGVWELNTITGEIWMSGKARNLFQFEPTAHVNHATMQERVHPEDRVLRDAAVKRVLETHAEYEIEYRLLLPDGSMRWIGGRGRCLSNADGRFTRLLGVSMDVTNRKLAEAEARQQREELGHLSRVAVMGEMAASIAHELNQPLSGIVSNAGAGQRFIDRGDVDLRELRALLVDISADGRRAGEVVRGIRRMVKKEETQRQPVDLNDVVMNVAHMMGPDALLHSCKVSTSLKPNLLPVEADPIQIQQVLINLVVNGFDAMRDTPVQNRKILMETEGNGDGVIEVSVRDYGVGISDGARERLFDRFFTTKREGLGLGLAIVRSIVEAHGGTIEAKNAAGGGARFHFTLPVSAQALT
jgi:two-component system sensor kinase FixL